MHGYVMPDKQELKVREFELYNGFYCGICKSIGEYAGQIERITLNYDSVFLAMLLDSLCPPKNILKREHCIIHHIDSKPVIRHNLSVDYCAQAWVILSHHKLLDDWEDEKKLHAGILKKVTDSSYNRLKMKFPSLAEDISAALDELRSFEMSNSGEVERAANCFGDALSSVFYNGVEYIKPVLTDDLNVENLKRILSQFGRALGCWIYLMDALDDYLDDQQKGNYNPILCKYPHGIGLEQVENYKNLLYIYMGEMTDAFDLLPLEKNGNILENILFLGMRGQADRVLFKLKEAIEE